MVISTMLSQFLASTDANGGSQLPNNPWPFVICAAALLVFVLIIAAAATIANHQDDTRHGVARRRSRFVGPADPPD